MSALVKRIIGEAANKKNPVLKQGSVIKGDLDLSNTGLTEIPSGITVTGELNLSKNPIKVLPEVLKSGVLDITDTEIESVPTGVDAKEIKFNGKLLTRSAIGDYSFRKKTSTTGPGSWFDAFRRKHSKTYLGNTELKAAYDAELPKMHEYFKTKHSDADKERILTYPFVRVGAEPYDPFEL